MANFTPSKKTAQDFNNGVEYVSGDGEYTGDVVSAETINNVVESQLWTQALATNMPDTTYIADEGAPVATIEFMPDGTPRFKFAHLKGRKGNTGESGVGALSNGMFYLVVDETTGDIYAEYLDGDTPPQFELDDNGDLYYIL